MYMLYLHALKTLFPFNQLTKQGYIFRFDTEKLISNLNTERETKGSDTHC